MGPRKRKAFDRDEADEAETADEGFMHPAPRFHVLFLVFLKGLQTIMDHTVMDLYMNLLDTFSYPLENTAHSCFVPIVFGSQGRFGRTCSITPPSSRRSTTPSGRHSSSATGVVQLTGQPLGKLRRS